MDTLPAIPRPDIALLTTVSLSALLSVNCAHAGNPVTQIHAEGIRTGTVGLGMGWRWGDSPYRGIQDIGSIVNDNEYDLMPFYYYEGKYLFARGSTAGVHLLDRNGFRLDAILDYRFDRLEADKRDFFRTVEDREQSLDGGLEAGYAGDWGEVTRHMTARYGICFAVLSMANAYVPGGAYVERDRTGREHVSSHRLSFPHRRGRVRRHRRSLPTGDDASSLGA